MFLYSVTIFKHLFGTCAKLFESVLVYSHCIITSNISAIIINELLKSSYNIEAFASEEIDFTFLYWHCDDKTSYFITKGMNDLVSSSCNSEVLISEMGETFNYTSLKCLYDAKTLYISTYENKELLGYSCNSEAFASELSENFDFKLDIWCCDGYTLMHVVENTY